MLNNYRASKNIRSSKERLSRIRIFRNRKHYTLTKGKGSFYKTRLGMNNLFFKKKNLSNRKNYSSNPHKVSIKPTKTTLLESLTKVINNDIKKKIDREPNKSMLGSYKHLMMRNDLSLGLSRFKFRLITNVDINNTYASAVSDFRWILKKLPRRTYLRFKKGRFIFTFILVMLFMDVFILSEYFNKLFYRTKFYFQRRLFYNFRKLLPHIFSTCRRYSLIKGIYLSFKGKIASSGGTRKRVLRTYAGIYGSSNFGIQHKYKFKQIWSKSGAIGLKSIIMCSKKDTNV